MIFLLFINLIVLVFFILLSRNIYQKPRIIKTQYEIPIFLENLWQVCKTLVKAFLYIRFLLPVFCGLTVVASGSMTPTCETNDVAIYTNIPYGFKLFNVLDIQMNTDAWYAKSFFAYSQPMHGDVMTFKIPAEQNMIFTKRIIGCPGDKVSFQGGIIFLNDKPLSLEYIGPYQFLENEHIITRYAFRETLPNGVSYIVLYKSEIPINSRMGITETFIIPKGHRLMIGDNRESSDDSRNFLSYVKEENIKGKVFYRLISNGNISTLNLIKIINGFKWKQCFTWIK